MCRLIDFSYHTNAGEHRWSDPDRVVNYTNWAPGEPDRNKPACIQDDGQWKSADHSSLRWICAKGLFHVSARRDDIIAWSPAGGVEGVI